MVRRPSRCLFCAIGLLALGAWIAGCDLGLGQRAARRTVVGVSPVRVVLAAQEAVAEHGLELAAVYPRRGNLRTAWLERPRVRIEYTVSTDPFVGEDGERIPGTYVVKVGCKIRERLVGGWSEEHSARCRTRELLDDIAQRLLDADRPVVRARRSESPPDCESSVDCPRGRHCAGGRCRAECEQDGDCEEARSCDERGRCVPRAPAPEPDRAEAEEPDAGPSAGADAGPAVAGEPDKEAGEERR